LATGANASRAGDRLATRTPPTVDTAPTFGASGPEA